MNEFLISKNVSVNTIMEIKFVSSMNSFYSVELSCISDIFIIDQCIPGTCVFYNSWKKSVFLDSGSNNQLSCSILRKIFMMCVGEYERTINYDWPYPFASNSFATSHVLSWTPIQWNPLYYKVFGIKHISVGDTQKHLSSANAKQQSR